MTSACSTRAAFAGGGLEAAGGLLSVIVNLEQLVELGDDEHLENLRLDVRQAELTVPLLHPVVDVDRRLVVDDGADDADDLTRRVADPRDPGVGLTERGACGEEKDGEKRVAHRGIVAGGFLRLPWSPVFKSSSLQVFESSSWTNRRLRHLTT